MKLSHLITATAAAALIGGAAMAQDQSMGAATDTTVNPPMTGTVDSATTSTGADGSMTTDVTSSDPVTGTTTATSATSYATGASVTTSMTTNGPVPDTADNRAKYGQPMSRAGKMTKASGN